MGRIIKITKSIIGKFNWKDIKNNLIKYLKKIIVIKENNVEIKIDRKFIKEYLGSQYTAYSSKKIKSIKANMSLHIVDIIENAGHIKKEKNVESKHNIDAWQGFEKYKARFEYVTKDEFNNDISTIYSCILILRCPNTYEKYLYDIVGIKKETSNPQ